MIASEAPRIVGDYRASIRRSLYSKFISEGHSIALERGFGRVDRQ